jgi:mannose-6-phosphate isomerase-like protein (cupin superfamily)
MMIPASRESGSPTYRHRNDGEAIWVARDTCTLKVTGEETAGRLLIFEASTPPAGGPPPHIHHAEAETYFILEGEYEVMLDERTLTAHEGDLVFIPPGVLHTYANRTQVPSRMLTIFTPAGFEGYLRAVGQPARLGEPAPSVGPEDIARFLAHADTFGIALPTLAPQEA